MEYFAYIKSRIPFPIMQEHCAQKELATARGWDLLQAKLEEESHASAVKAADISDKLREIFHETISVGTRAVKLYEIDEAHAQNVLQLLSALQPEASDYLNAYPKPLGAEQLVAQGPELKLCAVNADIGGHKVGLVFCGRRMVEEKEPRSRADIGDAAINQFGWQQYDEFILIRRRFVQSFEIVRYNSQSRLLELRVEDYSGSDTGVALQQLQDKVNGLLAAGFGNAVQLVLCRNLFPAIDSIYSDANEGIVVELGFTTETGSAKHEKMRASRADLRTELFHVGGKQAINGAMTPFRVAVRWTAGAQRGQGLQEEALLPGSIRQLANGQPFLDHMVLSGALTEAMMQALVARVVAHLP